MAPRKRYTGKDNNQQLPTLQPKKASDSKKCKFEPKHVAFILIGLGCGYFVTSFYDQWCMSKLVYTPFSSKSSKSFYQDMNRFWGTYRPQVYMGMKTKSQQSLVTGLMWLQQNVRYFNELPIRHECNQGDQIRQYGWLAHDGVNFGIQDIVEHDYILRTEFVKQSVGDHGGDWTWRISGLQSNKKSVELSIIFYVATDGQGNIFPIFENNAGKKLETINGETNELGKFNIFFPNENYGKKCIFHTVSTKAKGIDKIKDAALKKFEVSTINEKILYYLKDTSAHSEPANFKSKIIFHQVTVDLPFELEIIFESETNKTRSETLSGTAFTKALTNFKNKFDKKFESRFPLEQKGYDLEHVKFAKAALSNLIGGVGHFYGHSLVQSKYQDKPISNWDAHLITAVPSRSFFPRGFLWDEGFHELLISKWDRMLSEEIISSWLDLINVEGWIAREQILGSEARSKVPKEFIVQHNTNANPPTLFLAIQSIIETFDVNSISEKDKKFLKRVYPQLKVWYQWFNITQSGSLPTTYRWRGRVEGSDAELNPKTLTSGLDDYPRASHPSNAERHVDLRCWMAIASETMSKIAYVLHGVHSSDYHHFTETYKHLTDLKMLNELHWSHEMGLYSDYGNHTDRVSLIKKKYQPSHQGQKPFTKVVRVERQNPKLQFVNSYGYVSLFPFLLHILPPDCQQLNQILQDLKVEDALWTPFGLRSLSKRDPFYKKRNTEHDPPYWRGQIWININFLAIKALKFYSKQPGPYVNLAAELYTSLRNNVIENMYRQYLKSGYLWENYDDVSGKGQGSHPFTGWSALVVLIMSEQY